MTFPKPRVVGWNRKSDRSKISLKSMLQEALVNAVVKRLMSDAPLAMLLSGGLDSSLVAAIAVRCASEVKLFLNTRNIIFVTHNELYAPRCHNVCQYLIETKLQVQ